MLLFAAGLAMLSKGATMQVPPALDGVHRIVMMGDSITQLGADPKGYVTLVTKALAEQLPQQPITVINAGISGQKSTEMHTRFQKDVLDQHPDLFTLSVGVNDVWHDFRTPSWTARVLSGNSGRGVKLPVYRQEVEAMVKEALAANVKVVLLSPTLIYEDLDCAENKRLDEYVKAEREIADQYHVTFIDLNHAFREAVAHYQQYAGKSTLLLTIDGVHMNDQGNALMADMVLKALGVAVADHVTPH